MAIFCLLIAGSSASLRTPRARDSPPRALRPTGVRIAALDHSRRRRTTVTAKLRSRGSGNRGARNGSRGSTHASLLHLASKLGAENEIGPDRGVEHVSILFQLITCYLSLHISVPRSRWPELAGAICSNFESVSERNAFNGCCAVSATVCARLALTVPSASRFAEPCLRPLRLHDLVNFICGTAAAV